MCWPDGSSPTTDRREADAEPGGRPPVPIAGLPIRSWGGANQRLAQRLNPSARRALAEAMASRTARTAEEAGGRLLVVSSDPQVLRWAEDGGRRAVPEPEEGGLNGAARAIAEFAVQRGRPWLILHSDLPCLTAEEVAGAIRAVRAGRRVLAPSYDGGTSAHGGTGPGRFAYGPGSFHRHLRASPPPLVLVRLGFLLDMDSPADLETARRHPRGAWLNRIPQLGNV